MARAFPVEGRIFVHTCATIARGDGNLGTNGRYTCILAFTEPAGYGLWKSGWVAVTIPPGANPSVELFLGWIEESYRAIAPKKLVTQINAANL
jgi:hypothetical protein